MRDPRGRTCTDMALSGRSKEEFLRRFMRPEHGIPGHDAFSALFRIIDPDSLGGVLTRLAEDWSRRLGPDVIAIDGKTLRRSFEDASERVPLHVVSAFAAGARLTPGQVRVEGKSNEITAMPALPDIRGGTVTAGAMHTLRPTAEEIIRLPTRWLSPRVSAPSPCQRLAERWEPSFRARYSCRK
ncbi:MAG: ISAs1 family transposase [Rhodobacteraceae bacterium]|nr:ISAs1 family transposase [Paracoccaceae bacterium]